MSGNATGNVTFHINGRDYTIDLINGNATLPNNLTYGNNFVVAVYNGDGNYTDAYAMKNFIVDPITTDLTINATPLVIIGEGSTVIIVNMTNVTSGSVIIEVNGYNYTVGINSSGIAKLVVDLPAGKYNATAYYIGDDQHVACSNISNNFEVIDKITPEINITAPSVVKVGETINITVKSNVDNVTVWINGVKQTVVDGNISYTVTSAGIKTIYAEVTGNATVRGANRTVVFEAVKHNATLIIGQIDVVKVGDDVTIIIYNITDGELTIKLNGKAIANGYNVSMITGKNKFKGAAEGISYTGSYWLSSMPIAAALATVKKMKEVDYAGTIKKNGEAITSGWVKVAKDHGFDLKISGEPAMWYARLVNDFPSTILHQEWCAEMVKRGVFVASHHNNFAPFAIDQEDIQYCWDAADEAYKVVAANHPEANFIK